MAKLFGAAHPATRQAQEVLASLVKQGGGELKAPCAPVNARQEVVDDEEEDKEDKDSDYDKDSDGDQDNDGDSDDDKPPKESDKEADSDESD